MRLSGKWRKGLRRDLRYCKAATGYQIVDSESELERFENIKFSIIEDNRRKDSYSGGRGRRLFHHQKNETISCTGRPVYDELQQLFRFIFCSKLLINFNYM